MSKERVTILHCVSMSGEKEPLLVIGKAAQPRAFKRLNGKALPVMWKSNKKAWMTGDIMTEWLQQFDRKIGHQKRKILLFLDNAGSHPQNLKLKNIKILFLPPNTTSICQPLDQGIIKNFKVFYRTFILKHILSRMDGIKSTAELSKSIDLLEAIYFIKNAWEQVSPSTIKNCFLKAGFKKTGTHENTEEFDAEDDLPLSTIAELLKGVQVQEAGLAVTINSDNFVNIDDNLTTEDNSIDITDIDSTQDLDEVIIEEQSDDDSENSHDVGEGSINSYEEALSATASLKQFCRKKEDFTAFQLVKNVEIYFEKAYIFQKNEKKRQSSLLDFFPKTT